MVRHALAWLTCVAFSPLAAVWAQVPAPATAPAIRVTADGVALWAAIDPAPLAIPDARGIERIMAGALRHLQKNSRSDWEAYDEPRHGSGAGLSGAQWGLPTAVATFALLSSGVSPADPRIARALDWLDKAPVTGTQATAWRSRVWSKLPPEVRNKYKATAQFDAQRIEFMFKDEGPQRGLFASWTSATPAAPVDLVASAAAVAAAMELPDDVAVSPAWWQRSAEGWSAAQQPDGGFTDVAPDQAISNTLGCFALYCIAPRVHAPNARMPLALTAAGREAPGAIHGNWAENLYWIGRAARSAGVQRVGGVDVYHAGAALLAHRQSLLGAFASDAGIEKNEREARAALDAAYAILFLLETRPGPMPEMPKTPGLFVTYRTRDEFQWPEMAIDNAISLGIAVLTEMPKSVDENPRIPDRGLYTALLASASQWSQPSPRVELGFDSPPAGVFGLTLEAARIQCENTEAEAIRVRAVEMARLRADNEGVPSPMPLLPTTNPAAGQALYPFNRPTSRPAGPDAPDAVRLRGSAEVLATAMLLGRAQPPALADFRAVDAAWRVRQKPDGSWQDNDTELASTANGLYALLACERALRDDASPADDKAIENALVALGQRVHTVCDNEPERHLYLLLRAARAAGIRRVGGMDIYRAGSELLLATQRPNGSWGRAERDDPEPMQPMARRRGIDSAYALMFLREGQAPVAINKIIVPGMGRRRFHDVANVVAWVNPEGVWPEAQWQLVDPASDPLEMRQSRMLYVTADRAVALSTEQEAAISRHLAEGGLLVGNAIDKAPVFRAWFRQLGLRLRPRGVWSKLPANDPIYVAGHVREKRRFDDEPGEGLFADGQMVMLMPDNDIGAGLQGLMRPAPRETQELILVPAKQLIIGAMTPWNANTLYPRTRANAFGPWPTEPELPRRPNVRWPPEDVLRRLSSRRTGDA